MEFHLLETYFVQQLKRVIVYCSEFVIYFFKAEVFCKIFSKKYNLYTSLCVNTFLCV